MLKPLAILAVAGIVAWNTASAKNNETAQNHQNTPENQPIPITVNSPDKQANPSDDKSKDNTKPQDTDTPIKRSEWWLIGIATGTAFVIGWQSLETRRAAQASRDSVALFLAKERARLTLRTGQYAWESDGTGQYSDAPILEFIVSNLGPTHTFNCRLFVSYLPTESEAPIRLPEMKEVEMRPTMKADSRDSHPRLHLELDSVTAIFENRAFLQVAGKLTYTDVFGEDRDTTARCIFAHGKWARQGQPDEN